MLYFAVSQTALENDVCVLKAKIQSLQVDMDNSEAVQRDFVKLSQSLQVIKLIIVIDFKSTTHSHKHYILSTFHKHNIYNLYNKTVFNNNANLLTNMI